jgi:EPS-associated MarR family transcriptional regulator
MKSVVDEETRYKILSFLHDNPDISQRQLAGEMGVSVGKVNYCLKALIDVGYVKFCNFATSKKKMGYMYVLTPTGVSEKVKVTIKFLEIKQRQYDQMKKDIAKLQKEVLNTNK